LPAHNVSIAPKCSFNIIGHRSNLYLYRTNFFKENFISYNIS